MLQRGTHTFIAALIAVPAVIFAQIRQYDFGRITIDDGLSSYRVYDAARDSLGFLWVGTREGLDRYDGYRFRTFHHDPNDSMSLSDDVVRSLLIDRSGTLWAGTEGGGLNRYDATTEQFTRFSNSPSDPASISPGRVTAIYEDPQRGLWVGTLGGGLNRFDRERMRFTHYRHDPAETASLGNDSVYAISGDSSGNLWLATNRGVSILNPVTGRCERIVHSGPSGLTKNSTRAVCVDRSGSIWIAMEGGGLDCFNRRTRSWIHYRHDSQNPWSISHNDVSCIHEDLRGNLWVGTSDNDGGLNLLDRGTGRFTSIKNDPFNSRSLLHNYVRNIRPDNEGLLWIVTDRGLSTLGDRTTQFRHFVIDARSQMPQSVYSILESRDGRSLWIGSEGLRLFNAQTGRPAPHVPTNAQILTNPVLVMYEDKKGAIWIGSSAGGAEKLDPMTERVVHVEIEPQGSTPPVSAIIEDQRGTLWIGTDGGGLMARDPATGSFSRYRHHPDDPRSLSHNAVSILYVDRTGTLWVGTEGGGLNRFDRPGEFTRFRHDRGDPQNLNVDQVYAILEDTHGRMWISTRTGLAAFDRKTGKFRALQPAGRDPTGTITSMLEDRHGRLWLSTMQNGIEMFDPATEIFRNYDVGDGLQSNRFYFAGIRRASGDFIFGGENGITVFNPDSIRDNPRVPTVVLTAFSIFGTPARFATALTDVRQLQFRYNQNYFSFEFAALGLTAPLKNRYAYRLEGVDTSWAYPERRRFASYTNIDPGTYTLRIRGSNSDGVWNEAGIAIPITITPPFWATWWFRSAIVLVVIAILTALYRYRVSKLIEMERMRLRIASDLHDDIGSSLGSIALITDMVGSRLPPDQADRQQLTDVSRAARHTADALRDIVWIINPEHERLDDIILRMKDSAAKLLPGIDYQFECPENAMSSVLDMEFRRHLLLMYKEILHNIARHSHATRVTIAISERDHEFSLRIVDNGVGFDATQLSGGGNGLRNLRARAAKIGGEIRVESHPGEGTTVAINVPMP